MNPVQILTSISMTSLENWAQIAEIVIALGSIFSIWFSIKSLRKSDWNSNMAMVPSITLNLSDAHFWLSESSGGGGSWGEPTYYLNPTDKYITFTLKFSVLNQGRGVALSLEQPEIDFPENFKLGDSHIPVSMGVGDEPASFEISIIEKHERWLAMMDNPLKIGISLKYTNDQGNVCCTSKWTAQLKPFDRNGSRLDIRGPGRKIIGANMKVLYKHG